jgi:hypothetical protein
VIAGPPLRDTVCACGHWYDEHDAGDGACGACDGCPRFEYDEHASSPDEIADRGGDPLLWPEHVKAHFRRHYPDQVPELMNERD